jgi:tetratricopeptide (TPR) repeat protein
MKWRKVHIAVMAGLLVGLGVPLSVPAGQGETALEKARQAFEQRADPHAAKASLEFYQEAAKENPGSYEACWEGARAYAYYLEYPFADEKDEVKIDLAQKGINLAKDALRLKGKGVEAHYWLGVLYGLYGEAKGVLKSLSLVPRIKNEMDICMTEDPSVDCYGPERILGRMYYELPWFAGGRNRMSLRYLEASVKECPENDLTRLYLAETYKAVGKDDQAKEQLGTILNRKPDPRWAPEYSFLKARAEKMLETFG